MRDQPWDRIFISYSRKDGAECAAKLRKWLLNETLSVWQDIITLEGGRDWWSQIEDALKSKSLQHFVLIVTPAALASPVVRREIRLARQEGLTAKRSLNPCNGIQISALSYTRARFLFRLPRPPCNRFASRTNRPRRRQSS